MRRGSTPSVTLIIPGIDLTTATVHVAVAQGCALMIKTGDQVTVEYDADDEQSVLTVPYSQQDTLSFTPGRAQVQVRWIYSDGRADGTAITTVLITPVLEDGVITYG